MIPAHLIRKAKSSLAVGDYYLAQWLMERALKVLEQAPYADNEQTYDALVNRCWDDFSTLYAGEFGGCIQSAGATD